MKTVMIRLSLVENVNKFVNIVGHYPFEMDLRAGRHVVDAKSILGIFSMSFLLIFRSGLKAYKQPPAEAAGGYFIIVHE